MQCELPVIHHPQWNDIVSPPFWNDIISLAVVIAIWIFEQIIVYLMAIVHVNEEWEVVLLICQLLCRWQLDRWKLIGRLRTTLLFDVVNVQHSLYLVVISRMLHFNLFNCFSILFNFQNWIALHFNGALWDCLQFFIIGFRHILFVF